MKEVLMTTNAFNKSKELTDNDALSVLITRLILLEPGKVLGMPLNAGVGLISKYRFIGKDDLYKLKKDIEDQVSIYIPGGESADITVEMKKINEITDKYIIMIGVRIGMYIYAVGTDGENIYQNVSEDDSNNGSLSSLL